MKIYRLFNHTADIGCEVYGKTRKKLFANAAAALGELLFSHRQKQKNDFVASKKPIAVEGADLEDLLFNFLREILYLFYGQKLVWTNCQILELKAKSVVASLQVERYNLKKHAPAAEIKAVTYHAFRIRKTKSGWKAKVIFDV